MGSLMVLKNMFITEALVTGLTCKLSTCCQSRIRCTTAAGSIVVVVARSCMTIAILLRDSVGVVIIIIDAAVIIIVCAVIVDGLGVVGGRWGDNFPLDCSGAHAGRVVPVSRR
jgi:hypothetical protein